jgi:hypothetical protein
VEPRGAPAAVRVLSQADAEAGGAPRLDGRLEVDDRLAVAAETAHRDDARRRESTERVQGLAELRPAELLGRSVDPQAEPAVVRVGPAPEVEQLDRGTLGIGRGRVAGPASAGGERRRNSASTPTATAARASVATCSRSPPELAPRPPGSCTEWVASKHTGAPSARMTGSARKSTTRLL